MGHLKPVLAVFALLLPAIALAHGPARQDVTMTVDVPVPQADVWVVAGNWI